jgi:hypothetical protein
MAAGSQSTTAALADRLPSLQRTPLSDVLAGKSLKINTDGGPQLTYTFKSKNKLVLVGEGHGRVECGYGALTLNAVVLF